MIPDFSSLLHEFTETNVANAARTMRTPADAIDSIAHVSFWTVFLAWIGRKVNRA